MEAKPIFVAFDTEDLGNWIDSSPDWLEESLSDDEVDDETFERAKQWVIDRSTDGRLADGLCAALFDTWVGEQFNDLIWDVVMDFVRDEAVAFMASESRED